MKGDKKKKLKNVMTKKEDKDRNTKAKAEFKKVSDEKAKQEYYDYVTKDVVKIGKEMRVLWLQTRDMEEEMKMKEEQIEGGIIKELYNGMPKSKGKVVTEYYILEHDMKMCIYNMNKNRDKLKKFELTDAQVKEMINGEFDYENWHKNRKKVDKKD